MVDICKCISAIVDRCIDNAKFSWLISRYKKDPKAYIKEMIIREANIQAGEIEKTEAICGVKLGDAKIFYKRLAVAMKREDIRAAEDERVKALTEIHRRCKPW